MDDGCSGDPACDLEVLLADACYALGQQGEVLRAWREITRTSRESRRELARSRSCLQAHLTAWSALVLHRQRARIAACVVGEGCYVQPQCSRTIVAWRRAAQVRLRQRIRACREGVCLLRWTLADWSQTIRRIAAVRHFATLHLAHCRRRFLLEWAAVSQHSAHIRRVVQRRISSHTKKEVSDLMQNWLAFTQRMIALRVRSHRLLERSCTQKLLQSCWRIWRSWCDASKAGRMRSQIIIAARLKEIMTTAYQCWHDCSHRVICNAFLEKRRHGSLLKIFQCWRDSKMNAAVDEIIQPLPHVDAIFEPFTSVLEDSTGHPAAREAEENMLLPDLVVNPAFSCSLQAASSLQMLEEFDTVNTCIDPSNSQDSRSSSNARDHASTWLQGLPSPARSRRSSRGPTPSPSATPLSQSLDKNTSRAWSQARDDAFGAQQNALAAVLAARCTDVLCDAAKTRSDASTLRGYRHSQGILKDGHPSTFPHGQKRMDGNRSLSLSRNHCTAGADTRDIAVARHILKERQKVATHSLLQAAIDVLSDDHWRHKIGDNIQLMQSVAQAWLSAVTKAKQSATNLHVRRVRSHLLAAWAAWKRWWRVQQDHARFSALRFCWHAWIVAISSHLPEKSILEAKLAKKASVTLIAKVFQQWANHVQSIVRSCRNAEPCIGAIGSSRRSRSPETKLPAKRSGDDSPRDLCAVRRPEANTATVSDYVADHPPKLRGVSKCRPAPSMEMLRMHWKTRYVHERLHRIDNLAVAAGAAGNYLRRCCKSVLHSWHFIRRLKCFSRTIHQQILSRASHGCLMMWKTMHKEITAVIAEQRVLAKRADLRMALGSLVTFSAARRKQKATGRLVEEFAASRRQLHRGVAVRAWSTLTCIKRSRRLLEEDVEKHFSQRQQRTSLRYLQDATRRAKLRKHCVRNGWRHIRHKAFDLWKSFHAFAKHRACVTATVNRKVCSRTQRILFQDWACLCNRRQHHRRVAGLLNERISAYRKSSAISKWQDNVTTRQQLKRIEQELLDRSTCGVQRKCFWILKKFLEHRKRCTEAAEQTSLVVFRRLCTYIFKAWSYSSWMERRSREAATWGAQHLLRTCGDAAFLAWLAFSSCRKHCKNAGVILGSCLAEKRCRRTLCFWRSSRVRRVCHRESLGALLDRFKEQLSRKTFSEWCRVAFAQLRSKAFAMAMSEIVHQDLIFDIFSLWKSVFVIHCKQRKLAEARISRLDHLFRSSALLIWRFTLRQNLMQQASLRTVFMAWSSTRKFKQACLNAAGLVTSMRRRQALHFFSNFLRSRRSLAHAYWEHSQMRHRNAVRAWRSRTCSRRSHRIQARVVSDCISQRRLRRSMEFLQQRRRHRYIARGSVSKAVEKTRKKILIAWYGFCQVAKQGACLASAMSRKINLGIQYSAFNEWVTIRTRRIHCRAVADSLHRQCIAKRTSRSIKQWQDTIMTLHELKKIERRLIDHSNNGLQSACYWIWQANVRRRKHYVELENQTLVVNEQNNAHNARQILAIWWSFTSAQAQANASAMAMSSAVHQHWKFDAFFLWRSFRALGCKQRDFVDRRIARIEHALKTDFFLVWQSHRCMGLAQKGSLRLAMLAWSQFRRFRQLCSTAERLVEGLRCRHSLSQLSRFSRSQIFRRSVELATFDHLRRRRATALRLWSSWANDRRRHRTIAQVAVGNIAERRVRRVLAAWNALCSSLKSCARVTDRINGMVGSRLSRVVFTQWRAFCCRRRHQRAAANSLGCNLCAKRVSGAIMKWQTTASIHNHMKTSELELSQRTTQGVQRNCLRAWLKYSMHQKHCSIAAKQISSVAMRRLCTHALNSWAGACAWQRRCREATMRGAQHLMKTCGEDAFQAWTCSISHRVRCNNAGQIVAARLIERVRRQTLHSWTSSRVITICHRHAVQVTVNRHNTQFLINSFFQWCCLVSRQCRRRASAMAMWSTVQQQWKSDLLLLWRAWLALQCKQNDFVEARIAKRIQVIKSSALFTWRSTLCEKLIQSSFLKEVLLAWSRLRIFKQMYFKAVTSVINLRRRRALDFFGGYTRLQTRKTLVANRCLVRYFSAWAAASQVLQHVRAFHPEATLRARYFAWSWIHDNFLTPALLSTWRDVVQAIRQQRAEMEYIARVNRRLLLSSFRSWLKVMKVLRVGHQVAITAACRQQRRSTTSWWQCFTTKRNFVNVGEILAQRFLIVLWRIGTWLMLQDGALVIVAVTAWKKALQDRSRFMNELQQFHRCCAQSTVFAAKVAARDVLDVLDAWHIHAAIVVATRRRYAFGIRRACLRPIRLAFEAFQLWRLWRSHLPSLERAFKSVTNVVDVVLLSALRQWHFQGVQQHRENCQCESLLRRTWTAWQERNKLSRQLFRGTYKLARLSLRRGFHAVHSRSLQLSRAEKTAKDLNRHANTIRYFRAWRLRSSKISKIVVPAIQFPLKEQARKHYLELGFVAWKCFSSPSYDARPAHLHRALQQWSSRAAEKRRSTRHMNIAACFALRQQLRKIWCHWLCAHLQGSPRMIRGNKFSRSIPQMADVVPAGRHLDRLTLWAVVTDQKCTNAKGKIGFDWLQCGASNSSARCSDLGSTRPRLRRMSNKENQPPLLGGADG